VAGLRQQVEQQAHENEGLKQRNAALAAEVEDLKSGEAAVEERARSELGMIKPGETFYRVVEPEGSKATDEDATPSEPKQ
jgi:cell division protein FtsB